MRDLRRYRSRRGPVRPAEIVLGKQVRRTRSSRFVRHERLAIDVKRVCDPVDVVEVADDVHHLDDLPVVQPLATQGLEIARGHFRRGHGELLRELTQDSLSRRHRRFVFTPAGDHTVGQLVITTRGTEILPVRVLSVETAIYLGSDRRQHLAIGGAQGRLFLHQLMQGLPIEKINMTPFGLHHSCCIVMS